MGLKYHPVPPPCRVPVRAAGCLERDETGALPGRAGTGQRTHVGSFGCLHRHGGGQRAGAAAWDRNTGGEGARRGGEGARSGGARARSGDGGGSRERRAGNPDLSQQAPRAPVTKEPDLSRRAPRGKRRRPSLTSPPHVTSIPAPAFSPAPELSPAPSPGPPLAPPLQPGPATRASLPAPHVGSAARIAAQTLI